jgi:hypothetical protein
MFPARNVLVNGGAFTVINEQNASGMTGVLYESVVNTYFPAFIYAKRSLDIASIGLGWRRP